MSKRELILGTGNPGKIAEFRQILDGSGYTFRPVTDIDPEETESTFDGNALLKARAFAKHGNGWAVSEDSGLVIPALNGLPGVWSARFCDSVYDLATGQVTEHNPSTRSRQEKDLANIELVLSLLANTPDVQRLAYYRAVLIVADQEGTSLFRACCDFHVRIGRERRGEEGFAYDPIAIPLNDNPDGKTLAELGLEFKNRFSHRRQALDKLRSWLDTL